MTRTTRTRPTNSTRPAQDNQADGGESPFSFSIDPNSRELPDNLSQIGDTPFYNTPPQIKTNECGQIHPSLAYVCDIDLQDPTSLAEPKYEISINGCSVCVTMTQNYSATETVSQTYCYLLPACRRSPEPPPEPPPSSSDYLIDWPSIPSLPRLPQRDPSQRYRIVFEIRCNTTMHYVGGGRNFDDYFGECRPDQNSNTRISTITLETQGIGELKQITTTYPRTEPVYDLDAYSVAGEQIIVGVFYTGIVWINNRQVFWEHHIITKYYSFNDGVYVREYEEQEDM